MTTAKKKLIIILSIIGVFVILMIVFGALFSVRTINVDTATYVQSDEATSRIRDYLSEDIIKTSGIKKGKNIIFINNEKAESKLEEAFPYARFKIVRTFPNKVTIYLYERTPVFRISKDGNWYIFDEYLKCLEIVPDANLEASGNDSVATLMGVELAFENKVGKFIDDVAFQTKLRSIIDGIYHVGETKIDIMSDILLEKDSVTGLEKLTLTVATSKTKIVINGTKLFEEKITYGVYIYLHEVSIDTTDTAHNHMHHLQDVTIEVLDKFDPEVQNDGIRVVCTNEAHKS